MQGTSVDARRFPGHVEVLHYLEAFAKRFKLDECVRFNTRVVSATPQSDHSNQNGTRQLTRWEVTVEQTVACSNGSTPPDHNCLAPQIVDAVVVCNGHYAEPRVPPMPGIDSFPGRCEHSHSYRRPEGYRGLRVVVIGANASGVSKVHPCVIVGSLPRLCWETHTHVEG